MNDEKIFIQLNKDYQYVENVYGEKNVGCVFASFDGGIMTTEAIIFPTFEDICLKNSLPTNIIDNGIHVKDIRCIFSDILKDNSKVKDALMTEYRIVNLRYENLFNKYFYNNRERICNAATDITAANILKASVIELLRVVFNENSTSIDFIKNLSDAEKIGLSALIDRIDDEGIVSIHKLCQEVDISRQVLNNLVIKMKEAHVAVISNMGNKGSFVKILDYRLINFNR